MVTKILLCKHEVLPLAYPGSYCDNVDHTHKVDCRMEFVSMPCSGIHLGFLTTLRKLRYVSVHAFPLVIFLDFYERRSGFPMYRPFGLLKLSPNPVFLILSSDYAYQYSSRLVVFFSEQPLLRRTSGFAFLSFGCLPWNSNLCPPSIRNTSPSYSFSWNSHIT